MNKQIYKLLILFRKQNISATLVANIDSFLDKMIKKTLVSLNYKKRLRNKNASRLNTYILLIIQISIDLKSFQNSNTIPYFLP